MKYKSVLFVLSALLLFLISPDQSNGQFLKRLKEKVQQTAEDHMVNDAGNATDKAIDKSENAAGNAAKGNGNQSDNSSKAKSSSSNGETTSSSAVTASSSTPSLRSYQNYDFVPGDTILFADDFTGDQDGEFPAHWTLEKGQAVVNQVSGVPSFELTEGNYARVYPRMKTKSYLTDPFTIEFDYLPSSAAYGPVLFLSFTNADGNADYCEVHFTNRGGVETSSFPHDFSNDQYPGEDDATFFNHWHHCALIYKNNQIKCYVDQHRILVIPNTEIVPYGFGFGGIGDENAPIVITNVRAAKGGSMNVIGKKFTESKIVTHGITFDIDKSDIKPESMGTLNMIKNVLKNNPDLKFEIDGHTDNTGDAAHNLTLSQQRAEAVKVQLIKMGIDGSRLSTKGFGDTKPISDNNSPEGKANNRRVEFVKV